jgi:hypothetical protein
MYERDAARGYLTGFADGKHYIGNTIGLRVDEVRRRRDQLAEANVCRLLAGFCVIDVDTHEVGVVERIIGSGSIIPANVATPHGSHIYVDFVSPVGEELHVPRAAFKRLSEVHIDLKWSGIVLAPGSVVDEQIYREASPVPRDTRWSSDAFQILARLPGITSDGYPPSEDS